LVVKLEDKVPVLCPFEHGDQPVGRRIDPVARVFANRNTGFTVWLWAAGEPH
jgi:hypothetical protein